MENKLPPKHHAFATFMQPPQYNLRFSAAKDKKYSARSHSSEEPWRSHSTAICTGWIAKHNSTASTAKEKKPPGHLSYSARAVPERFDGKPREPAPVAQASQLFSATEPPFTRKTMFRADPNIQITSLMLQFQCDLPTTCKTQSESQQMTQEQVAFEEPWRSYSTAICRDRVAKHKSLVVAAAPGRAAHRPILSEHARRCAISRHAAQAGMQNWQLGALTERLWRARLCCLRDRHAKGVHLTGAINAPRDVTARDKMLRLQRGWTLVPQPTRFEWKYMMLGECKKGCKCWKLKRLPMRFGWSMDEAMGSTDPVELNSKTIEEDVRELWIVAPML